MTAEQHLLTADLMWSCCWKKQDNCTHIHQARRKWDHYNLGQ